LRLQPKGIQEVRTWLVQRSETARKGRQTQVCLGSRVLLVTATATASRSLACPMAGSVSATARTHRAQCSGSPQASGVRFWAAPAMGNSTALADNVQIGQALPRPACASHLSIRPPREKPLRIPRRGFSCCAVTFTPALFVLLLAGVLTQ